MSVDVKNAEVLRSKMIHHLSYLLKVSPMKNQNFSWKFLCFLLICDMFIGLYLKNCSGDLRPVLWELVTYTHSMVANTSIGCIHTHFVYSISNSTVDHIEIVSINPLFFVTDGYWWKYNVFNMVCDVEYGAIFFHKVSMNAS